MSYETPLHNLRCKALDNVVALFAALRNVREPVPFRAFTLQPDEFVTLGRRQIGSGCRKRDLAPAFAAVSPDPLIHDGLRRGFELAGEIGRITPGTNQMDRQPAELGWVFLDQSLTNTDIRCIEPVDNSDT